MTRWGFGAAVAVLLTLAFAVPASAAQLDAYTAVVKPNQLQTLAEQGFDITTQQNVAGGIKVGLVLDQAQRDAVTELEAWDQWGRLDAAEHVLEREAKKAPTP